MSTESALSHCKYLHDVESSLMSRAKALPSSSIVQQMFLCTIHKTRAVHGALQSPSLLKFQKQKEGEKVLCHSLTNHDRCFG